MFIYRFVDIKIGGLFPKESIHIKTLVAYHTDDITWCIAAVQKINFNKIFGVFTLSVWLSLVGGLLIVSFGIYFLTAIKTVEKRIHFHDMWLTAVAIILNQSSTFNPKTNLVRVFFGPMLLCGVLTISIFNSMFLKHITQHVSSTQKENIAEMQENNFQWFGSTDAMHIFQVMHYL